MLKIFLLDYIIANVDRHSYNISFLRNSDTMEWIGVAPVYDSGKSMFVNKLDFEIEMTSSFRIGSKPFEENQAAQFNSLPMEKLAGLIDFSSLSDIDKWYKKFLAPLRRLPSEKKAALVKKLEERIKEAQILILEKQRFSQGKDFSKSRNKEEESLFLSENTPVYGKSGVKVKSKSGAQAKESSEDKVFTALVQDSHQTKEELCARLALSRATVTRALQKLTAENKIRRRGANKNGYWEIL